MKPDKQTLNFLRNVRSAALILCLLTAAGTKLGQTLPPFISGSTGSDGVLSLTTAGTYFFDPNDVTTFGHQLDTDGDGVFNFTTVTIGTGVTLRFAGDRYNRPVYWLASGNVVINGILDLNGANGVAVNTISDFDARRKVTVPGSGGFSGGAGGSTGTPSSPASAGDGPGGGTAGATCSTSTCGQGGTFAGTNKYVVPLIGGSGGQGGVSPAALNGGGAGGGGILIASSGSITLSGSTATINAKGGTGANGIGGAGSGGAIRLVARSIESPAGRLHVEGITTGTVVTRSTDGTVRIEAFQVTSNGVAAPSWAALAVPAAAATSGFATNAFVLNSSIRVVSIDSIPVPPAPAGSFFQPPDLTINKTTSVPVVVQGSGIPSNTPIRIEVLSENPDDPATVAKTYNGTLDTNLQAVVNIPFPFGLSRCYIRVTWVQ